MNVFENHGLKITIKPNVTAVDFPDIRLNLKNNTYEPYEKPNSNPIYMTKYSSNPANIIMDTPKLICTLPW